MAKFLSRSGRAGVALLAALCLLCASVLLTAGAGAYVPGTYQISDPAGLNIRSGPSADTDKLGAIPYRETVTVTAVEGNFGRTAYRGIEGWICLDYATLMAPADPDPDPGPTPELPGDVNGDGSVNSSDARLVLQASVEAVTLTEQEALRADVTGDGAVNSTDARWILQAAVSGGGADEPYTPILQESPVDETVYTSRIQLRNTSTGTVYSGETREGLQLAVASLVKHESGSSRLAEKSTAAWQAQAVLCYTQLAEICYDSGMYSIALGSDLDLDDANDRRLYDAVGEVLGIKLMDLSQATDYDRLALIFYFATAPGTTASCHKVYTANLPYLQSVSSPETEALVSYYYGGNDSLIRTVTIGYTELLAELEDFVGYPLEAETDPSQPFPLYAVEYDGNYVYRTNLYYLNRRGEKTPVTGYDVRRALGLRSHAFEVVAQDGDTLTLQVSGNGHGVGYSQIGAAIYANEYGWTYDQILAHYFSITPTSPQQLCLPRW